jgi:hypothetical protein
MQARLKDGEFELAVVFGPEPFAAPAQMSDPGAWKTEPSDPQDPDPLNLGALDAEPAFDDPEVSL